MNRKDILFYGIIILVVCLSIYLIYYVQTESFDCMREPLVYGVNKLSVSTGEEVKCTCSSTFSKHFIVVTKNNISIESFIK